MQLYERNKRRLGGGELLSELEGYFTHLDENSLQGNGEFDHATRQVIYPTVPNPGSATGFCLFMRMPPSAFIAHRVYCPTEFQTCTDRLRKRLLKKATAKDFAKLIARRPLLDLELAA